MTFSSNPNTYQDVRRVLDHVLAHGEIKLKFPSFAKAKYFAQRCYAFLRITRKLHEERMADFAGFLPPTPYDNLLIQRFKQGDEREAHVYILFRETKTLDGVTTLDGLPIEFDPIAAPDDPLEEEARRLAEDLNLDLE